MGDRRQHQTDRLNPHSGSDQPFSAPAIAQRTGYGLKNSPNCGVHGLQNANALDAQPMAREEQRENPPAHPVIQVFAEPGLARGKQIAVAERRSPKYLPECDSFRFLLVAGYLERDMLAGITDQD